MNVRLSSAVYSSVVCMGRLVTVASDEYIGRQ